MNMENYIIKPDISLHPGIKVEKKTKVKFRNENVSQILKDLVLQTTMKEKQDNFESTTLLTIKLNVGEVLLFDDKRGYFLPAIGVCAIQEAINDLEILKEV